MPIVNHPEGTRTAEQFRRCGTCGVPGGIRPHPPLTRTGQDPRRDAPQDRAGTVRRTAAGTPFPRTEPPPPPTRNPSRAAGLQFMVTR